MSTPTSGRLRDAVANAAQPGASVAERPQQGLTINDLIDRQRAEIAKALPKHMDPDRLARTVVTVIKGNPKLLEATPQSLLAALMLSAQLGLEPGPLGHCYFVPFKNNNAKVQQKRGDRMVTVTTSQMEVQWILGYKGIIHLAHQSGLLASIEARAVFAKDAFDFEFGFDERLQHRPFMDGDRGELKAFYGIARFTGGGRYATVMSKADVDKHRERSRAKDSGPWVTDYVPMGCKTVIRTMQPYLPMSIELVRALAADGAVNHNYQQGVEDMVDAQPADRELPATPNTGQVHEGDVVDQQEPGDEPGEQVNTGTGEVINVHVGSDAGAVDDAAGEPPAGYTPPPPDVEDPPEDAGWPDVPAPGSKGSSQ